MANNLPHIISGTAKGKKLQVAAGTRPLTGRIKQSLFGLLGFDNPGQDFSSTTVLDLFAGSGSFGLEALSRGAKSAVFVEEGPEAFKFLKENIHNTGFAARAEAIRKQASTYLKSADQKFGIIFLDPPFPVAGKFPLILVNNVAGPDSIIIFRLPTKTDLPPHPGLEILHQQDYGESTTVFLRKTE